MPTATGVYVTPEELHAVKVARDCSGMWDSTGKSLGDPQAEVARLAEQYGYPRGTGLNLRDGQFYLPD